MMEGQREPEGPPRFGREGRRSLEAQETFRRARRNSRWSSFNNDSRKDKAMRETTNEGAAGRLSLGAVGARRLAALRLVSSAATIILTASCVSRPPSAEGTTSPPPGNVYSISFVAGTVNNLPQCTTAQYGTTAFVQSPVSLYDCQAGKWILIPCTTAIGGAVAYATASQTLLACVSGQWTQIALPTGPQGPTGTPGAMGATGATGPAGPQGDSGAVSIVVQVDAPSSVCPNGGTEIESGVDKNGDGKLQDPEEITSISYVCNGATGDAGAIGPQGPVGPSGDTGPAGAPGSQIQVSPADSSHCPAGGEQIDVGVAGDGEFAIQQTVYVCNGTPGAPAGSSCASNPCLNGGNCIDVAGSHVCSCQAGFTGTNCETTETGPCGGNCPGRSIANCIGECRPGTWMLVNGVQTCVGSIGPVDETCNGLDDDCDGQVDERNPTPGTICANGGVSHACRGVVDPMVKVNGVFIYQYEASRPDATGGSFGADDTRACSKAGALPWTLVTWEEAATACAAVKAADGTPMRLCSGAEWTQSCNLGNTVTPIWAFRTMPTVYDYYGFNFCNDLSEGLQRLWATGSGVNCAANPFNASGGTIVQGGMIFDLSGNAAEWTSTSAPIAGQVGYEIHGGSYNDGPGPDEMACNAQPPVQLPSYRANDVGFRCCSTSSP